MITKKEVELMINEANASQKGVKALEIFIKEFAQHGWEEVKPFGYNWQPFKFPFIETPFTIDKVRYSYRYPFYTDNDIEIVKSAGFEVEEILPYDLEDIKRIKKYIGKSKFFNGDDKNRYAEEAISYLFALPKVHIIKLV